MEKTRTEIYYICDKCGKEAPCDKVESMDLCEECQMIWKEFMHQKTDKIVSDYIITNTDTIFKDFKKATLEELNIVKKY